MRCPVCNEESSARKKRRTEGWRIVGECEVCAVCGAPWPEKDEKDGKNGNSDASRRKLAALLGGEDLEKVSLSGREDRRFCRVCRHFTSHPFKSICGRSGLEADPMGSCPDFDPR